VPWIHQELKSYPEMQKSILGWPELVKIWQGKGAEEGNYILIN